MQIAVAGIVMRLRLNLQQKILLLVAGSMSLILIASSYLHSSRIRSLIEKDHYDTAVSQTVALGNRIAEYDYFSNLEDLQQEMQVVVSSRPDFRQIDVYENQPTVPRLIATTATGTSDLLAAWDASTAATATQIDRNNGEYWLITTPISNGQHSGFIKALVHRSSHRELVNSLHREYNLVLFGAVIASVLLLYLLFVYFFRKPVKEIVQTKPNETVAITEVKFDHPIFEIFRESGRLSSAQVVAYARSEPQANADVLARFEDGSPTLIEWRKGKGRVLAFTTSLGPSWNDLPLTPAFLPFVHQMIKYAGQREEGSWYGLGQTFMVKHERDGTAPAIDTPAGARLTDTRSTADGDVLVTAHEPGFYKLRYSAQPDFAAVDINGDEGDFTKLNFAEFVAGVTGGAGNAEGGDASQNLSKEEVEGRQRIWWSLLFLALLLLVTESVLARRTKVVRMVGRFND